MKLKQQYREGMELKKENKEDNQNKKTTLSVLILPQVVF
jgi:hypothetical protein